VGKWTGESGQAAGATLDIVITTPSPNSFVYAYQTPDQKMRSIWSYKNRKRRTLRLFKGRIQAILWQITGNSAPNVAVSIKLHTSTHSVLETQSADIFSGDFSFPSLALPLILSKEQISFWTSNQRRLLFSVGYGDFCL